MEFSAFQRRGKINMAHEKVVGTWSGAWDGKCDVHVCVPVLMATFDPLLPGFYGLLSERSAQDGL
ncbi:hypothetical protein A9R04_20530 [Nocardiopsis dassonvillei]|nr:hypothetical protein A9R04_20530 [Nocardiopsis dassonvillei]